MLYDDLGRRVSLSRVNGVVTYSGYDGASRLASLTHRFPARADMAKSFTYNPAGQIVAEVQSPLGEAYAPPAGPRQAYAANALNQYSQAGGEAVSHNANGAQVARGGRQYSYDSADRLTSANAVGGASLSYDAAGRLGALVANGVSTRFVYDGGQLTGEVDGNGVMIRRYVPLPGPDETLAMYDSTGVSYPLADSRGTPMAWTLANGQIAVQQYGAFGEEGPANIGRFGFTGQMRLPEIGLDYYKARYYDPSIGRFLTPDPAGTIDSPNLYAYVLNDPINFTDPSGLCERVTGSRICRSPLTATDTGGIGVDGAGGGGGRSRGGGCAPSPDAGPDDLLVCGRRIPRMPFNPGPAFPIFGRTPGRMDLPPEISPDPEPGMMGEMMAMERARERLCAQINDAANRTRSNLPTNPNASTVEGLRFERAVAQLDLQVIGPLAGLTAFFGGAAGGASAANVPGTQRLGFSRVSFGVGTVAATVFGVLAARDIARVAAIDARLNQINAQLAGVCQ
jgi:RHS repeat-associated protein